MKTSKAGIDLIKRYEGCRLKAYKPVPTEKYWTIGFGHYGPDVTEGMTITQAQADAFLVEDIARFENAVNAQKLTLSQNQFDALVSFAYNCGVGNLAKLCKGRSLAEIADAMLLYDKSNGKPLAGLTRRRKEERELFLSGWVKVKQEQPKNGNPYKEPTKNVKIGTRGNDARWVQFELNKHGYCLIVDGIIGQKSEAAIIHYQRRMGLLPDGIVGEKTRAALNA